MKVQTYGSHATARMLLACVSACLETSRKDCSRVSGPSKALLQSYTEELAELEADIFAYVAASGTDQDTPIRGNSFGPAGSSIGDVHDL